MITVCETAVPFAGNKVMADGNVFQFLSGLILHLHINECNVEVDYVNVCELTSSRTSFLLFVPFFLLARTGIDSSF